MYDFNTENELDITVALVGEPNSGKTSLRNMHFGTPISDENVESSIGVQLFDRLEFYDEFSVRMNIWDIPGNEKLTPYTSTYIK